jgi:hypothetical protein
VLFRRVGEVGFEPTTTSTQSSCTTGLCDSPHRRRKATPGETLDDAAPWGKGQQRPPGRRQDGRSWPRDRKAQPSPSCGDDNTTPGPRKTTASASPTNHTTSCTNLRMAVSSVTIGRTKCYRSVTKTQGDLGGEVFFPGCPVRRRPGNPDSGIRRRLRAEIAAARMPPASSGPSTYAAITVKERPAALAMRFVLSSAISSTVGGMVRSCRQ